VRLRHILIQVGLAAILLSLSFPVDAQQPRKVPHIAYLSTVDSGLESDRAEAIRLALRDRGYIEGQNITIEYRLRRESKIGSLSFWPSWCVAR
jgi:putative ABC transport system substrate-binding protein